MGRYCLFFEKTNSKIYYTESTCTNTVIKDAEGYHILADLGHGMGSCEIKLIKQPRKLSIVSFDKINKTVNGSALGYTDKSKAFTKELDLYGVQIFSMFRHQNKNLYIVNCAELTFIAEIDKNDIEIINPLFFNDLYTHNPVTTKYNDYTLINLDHYGTGLDREISVLIIDGKKIKKIDWNENHYR